MIEEASKATRPTIVRRIRTFLRLCNDSRRIVKGFSHNAAPLNDILRKDISQRFSTLSDREMRTFEELKSKLKSPPILALPRKYGAVTVKIDACEQQVGTVVLRDKADGNTSPAWYSSHAPTKAEQNYDTAEREYFAAVVT